MSGSGRGRSIELVSSAIDEFSRFHIEMAFDSDCDPYLSIESREVIHSLFTQITQKLVSVDPIVCSLLLRPVCELMESEFSDVTGSYDQLKQFYVDVDILNRWHLADPRAWGVISSSFRILDEVTQIIQEEIDLVSIDPDTVSNSTPVRSRLNAFIRGLRNDQRSESLREFHSVFSSLVDLYDLVDLELFLDAFPGELHLRSGTSKYKPSFARKIALTAVKKWVNDHQYYKKNKESVSRRSVASKEDVMRACVIAHLDITSDNQRDRDCEYFWSHVRKSWLGSVLRSRALHLYEVFDHVETDPILVNQLLMHLEEQNETVSIAHLMVSSESLRSDTRRRTQMEDPLVHMLMSTMQTGRPECLSSYFGPRTNDAFVLPFTIDFDFRTSPIDSDSHAVYILDQATQLEALEVFLLDVSVITIDVFYRVYWSARLERAVPSVVSLAVENKVFIIMANRMARNSKSFHASLRVFFRRLLSDDRVLKIVGDMRNTEKDFFFWTLLVEYPFEVHESSSSQLILGPCLDLTDVYPRRSVGDLIFNLLGGIRFCDYEENSNWARADSDLLRLTQLHYIASKSWLSLQLFHTIRAENAQDIAPLISFLDFSQVFGSRFNCQWSLDMDSKIEAVQVWTIENEDKLERARLLVESSCQRELHQMLKADLVQQNDVNQTNKIIDFELHDDFLLAD